MTISVIRFCQKYRKMRRRQEEGMADAPHSPNPQAHIEYVSEAK